MPNLVAGTKVKGVDTPVSQFDQDTTTENPTNTSFETGASPAQVTFTAPTTGRVKITIGAGLAMSSGTSRCQVSYEVRENDQNGTVVQSSSTVARNVGTHANPGSSGMYMSRVAYLDGLTVGGTYFAQTMERVTSSGDTGAVFVREILVEPIP